jgi:hypothetical protein
VIVDIVSPCLEVVSSRLGQADFSSPPGAVKTRSESSKDSVSQSSEPEPLESSEPDPEPDEPDPLESSDPEPEEPEPEPEEPEPEPEEPDPSEPDPVPELSSRGSQSGSRLSSWHVRSVLVRVVPVVAGFRGLGVRAIWSGTESTGDTAAGEPAEVAPAVP